MEEALRELETLLTPREGNHKQDGREQVGFARAEERHVVPRRTTVGRRARAEIGPCQPRTEGQDPGTRSGGGCVSPERHPLHVSPEHFPQLKHPLPEIPIPIPHFSSPKSHPHRFNLCSQSRVVGPSPKRDHQGPPICHDVAISGRREPLATAAHSPEKGVPFPPPGLPKLEKHWVPSRSSQLSCQGE